MHRILALPTGILDNFPGKLPPPFPVQNPAFTGDFQKSSLTMWEIAG
jgi:hypothetical protein